MFLQYVFKQSVLCLIACLISSQQRSANTAEQQVLLVQSTVVLAPKENKSRGVKSGATYCYDRVRARQKSYHLRTLIDGQLVPVRGARTLIHARNSRTTCLRVYVPSQKMILCSWPIIPIIFSVRSCYTLYSMRESNENRTATIKHIPRKSWQHRCYVSRLPSVG